MEHNDIEVLFKEDFFIQVGKRDSAPLFYVFDYGVRSSSVNMEFQHFHSFYEIFILLDDSAVHIVEGEYFNLQKYDMVFLKPSVLHMTIYPQGGARRKRLIIAFRIPDDLPGLKHPITRILSVFDANPPVFRFSGRILKSLVTLLNDIFLLGAATAPGWELIVHCKFIEWMWTVYSHGNENHYKRSNEIDSVVQKIYEVTGYIHSNYMEPLSLRMLADTYYISSFYLSRQFKKVTGFTFMTYLHLTRIRNAQQHLLYTKDKIKDVAEKCGFTSFSQFNRVFNKFCGMSPSEFRRDKKRRTEVFVKLLVPERKAESEPSRAMVSPDTYIAVKKLKDVP
ncbi:helix-turn-helix domain-containing protein [Parasphaerochaeta coccoides]|uniref:Transcriptional regulator, AraC family n=1 Tax=Parasphaerochaeta coccoides (strain ATCC BAA-1237 / DSM 17374 / SPN1) TaxID=760011 RepID=F4GM10_PARC1|nr:helix-turn-helix domain-containing protein [Parasphaerochaeta coccoides]AEC02485.1 transcriptional regulator, AraC family [Parasphaerochaeta coccoides DSM 17374]